MLELGFGLVFGLAYHKDIGCNITH